MDKDIVVVGSLNMDLVTRADRIPAPGETVIGGDLLTVPGGKGANQAVAAARLGGKVSMIGRVGADDFGRQLKENLAASQVETAFIQDTDQVPTGVALIVVDQDGQNSIVVSSGANAHLAPADVEGCLKVFASARVVVLQLEVPQETVFTAARLARDHGVRVILNPAPARPLAEDLLGMVDILVPNENETGLLSGLPSHSLEELQAAAGVLQSMGVGTVILTLGPRGALLASPEEIRLFPGFAVDPVVDTTAAGDAFVGALAVAIGSGRSVAEAVPWGNAAGALATTKMGAQTSLPERAALDRLLQSASIEHLRGVKS